MGDAKQTAETSDSNFHQLATFPDGLVCFLDLNRGDKGPIWFLSEASAATSRDIYCARKKSIPGFLQSAQTPHFAQKQRRNQRKR